MPHRLQTPVRDDAAARRPHRGLVRTLLLTVLGTVAVLAFAAAPALAARPAARPTEHGHGKGGESGEGGETGGGGGGGEVAPEQAGYDVSYPQCGTTLPASPAFGIVGVNDGLANTLSPCLGISTLYNTYADSELYWALSKATGIDTTQPKSSLYVNTADPGNLYNNKPIEDWPKSGSSPDGQCTAETVRLRGKSYTVGGNSPACAWVYGYNKATQDVAWLQEAAGQINKEESTTPVSAAASAYPWWLDVETANTWQSGSEGQAMNVADLQGMLAALRTVGAPSVGIYSTGAQWSQITGGTPNAEGETLYGLSDWVPGATTLSGAEANCSLSSFTGGGVTITQWLLNSSIDADHVCAAA